MSNSLYYKYSINNCFYNGLSSETGYWVTQVLHPLGAVSVCSRILKYHSNEWILTRSVRGMLVVMAPANKVIMSAKKMINCTNLKKLCARKIWTCVVTQDAARCGAGAAWWNETTTLSVVGCWWLSSCRKGSSPIDTVLLKLDTDTMLKLPIINKIVCELLIFSANVQILHL